MTNEQLVHSRLVKTGILVIKDNGEIWRHKEVTRRAGKVVVDVEPRRAERITGYGYLRCPISIDNKVCHVFAHRLVYLHFFGEIDPELTINHKNGNKTDNRPENLEMVTLSRNSTHSWHVLKRGKNPPRNEHLHGLNHPFARFSRDEVIAIRNKLRSGQNVNSIARELGLATVLSISSINLGITYRDVLEEGEVTFPILRSKFKPNPKTACKPLPAATPQLSP